jgi:hypothetical protein
VATVAHPRIPSRTVEQAAAFRQLRALAAPFRFRVVADPEGFPVIPGRFGSIEYHDGEVLAVYTDRPRLFAKLWAIPVSAGTRRGTRKCGPCSRRRPSTRWRG